MRHVTRSWQATVLSGSAETRGAKHTVVNRWLWVSAQKVSLASVDLPYRSHVAVGVSTTLLPPVTSRVDHRGPTWPSASRFRPGTAWSGWASRDRQRTADNAHGHIAGAHSGGTRAPPASSQKNASPRLATDGLDDARSVGGWADARWNALRFHGLCLA